MHFFHFSKHKQVKEKKKNKNNTDPKPLLERRDSLESAGESNAYKITLNPKRKQKK
jgi:hypothetical protein